MPLRPKPVLLALVALLVLPGCLNDYGKFEVVTAGGAGASANAHGRAGDGQAGGAGALVTEGIPGAAAGFTGTEGSGGARLPDTGEGGLGNGTSGAVGATGTGGSGDGTLGGATTGGGGIGAMGGNPDPGEAGSGGAIDASGRSGVSGVAGVLTEQGGTGPGQAGRGQGGSQAGLGGDADGGQAGRSGQDAGRGGEAGAAEGCGSGLKLCDEECVLDSNPETGCGQESCAPCDLIQATAICVEDACAIDTCNSGYFDCNARPDDGCEHDRSSWSPDHCGGCGNSCRLQGTAPGFGCSNGVCRCTAADQCGDRDDVACGGDGRCVCNEIPCQAGEACIRRGPESVCACNEDTACAVGTTCCHTPPGCFDLAFDSSNCGACGWPCPTGTFCQYGECV